MDERKFGFLSQPIQSTSRLEINFSEDPRKLRSSQPSSVEFIGETNLTYYDRNDEPQQNLFANDEEDQSSEHESNIVLQGQSVNIENIDSENNQDIENMFNKYKQLGNELERNLLILEDKNTLQRNHLSNYKRDYDCLTKQKEKNKKCLIDLQIEVEHLDSKKQQARNNYENSIKQKLDTIGQLFQLVFSNDTYIKSLQNKFNDALVSEKMKFNSLLAEIKNETTNQKLFGEKYFEEMRNLYVQYENSIKNCNEQELKIDVKLDYLVQQYHLCSVEKESEKKELEKIIKIINELKDQITSLKEKKELFQGELATSVNENVKLKENYKNILDHLHCDEKNIFERFTTICDCGKALSNELNVSQSLIEEINKKNAELINLIEIVSKEKLVLLNTLSVKELIADDLKLSIANASHSQALNSQINDLLQHQKDLLDKKLNIENNTEMITKELEKLGSIIRDCEAAINNNLAKSLQETERKLELDEIYNIKFKALKDARAKQILSDTTQKLDDLEQRFVEVENLLSAHETETNKLTSNNENLKNTYNFVLEEIKEIKMQLNVIEVCKNALMSENEKQDKHLISIENLKKYLLDLEDDYVSLMNSNEAQLILEVMKKDLDNITNQNNLDEQFLNKQITSISDSFNSQLQNLNDQMKTLKIENEETVRKKINHNIRHRNAIPRIEETTLSIKNTISENLPSLIECIDNRLDYMNKLIETYKQASVEVKNKGTNLIEAKVVMTSTEKSLSRLMEQMMSIYKGPKLVATDNIGKYKEILMNVQSKYFNLLAETKIKPSSQIFTELVELAVCIYGSSGFPLKTIDDSISSSQRTLTSEDLR